MGASKNFTMPLDRDKIIPDILDRLASGQSLVSACRANSMSWSTWFDWMKVVDGLPDKYARARELQAEHYADEIIEISDNAKDAQKGRLQVDARKWIAAKLLPRKYGERLDLTSGGEKMPTVIVNVPPAKDGGSE